MLDLLQKTLQKKEIVKTNISEIALCTPQLNLLKMLNEQGGTILLKTIPSRKNNKVTIAKENLILNGYACIIENVFNNTKQNVLSITESGRKIITL